MGDEKFPEVIEAQSLELHESADKLHESIEKFESYLDNLKGHLRSEVAFCDPDIGCCRIIFQREGKAWKLFLASGDGSNPRNLHALSIMEKSIMAQHLPAMLFSMDAHQRALIERANKATETIQEYLKKLGINE